MVRRWLEQIFAPKSDDEIWHLREPLAVLVKNAMNEAPGQQWSIDVFGCSIRGIPVGDWRIIVHPIIEPSPPSSDAPPTSAQPAQASGGDAAQSGGGKP